MNQEYRRAYSKGYNAGARGQWPEHRPPAPPDPLVRKLFEALAELLGKTDAACATLDPNDDVVLVLGPAIDQGNAAMLDMAAWLKSHEVTP